MQEINQISMGWGDGASSICAVLCFRVPLVIALDLVFNIMNVAFLDVIGKIIIKKNDLKFKEIQMTVILN